ncbi:hypothetical protein DOA99_07630 [Salmonella enterica subsp. houtenae]|nr:hypothetical protein [Salmonella enterica subsp. houtenae]ECD9323734.1 hypothetical protein [Salmonella enterica subsp. houtenae]ECJ2522555.1 hypothetical protein [Salmonella enterica subsp. houtenae]EDS2902832.1 hypothetical protein [Salmonella enterica subsp. houtenae]EDX5630943.1 hypothetical protein [Salmonella enterica subsp. houtenae]
MSTAYIAFYKGRADHHSLARLADWVTRVVTRGIYSHCELALPLPTGEFRCYSSSVRDKGVRCKVMPLPAEKWDRLPLNVLPSGVEEFFQRHRSIRYDWLGALGNRGRSDKFFCSEFCAEFLHLRDSWRWSPNLLYALISSRSGKLTI